MSERVWSKGQGQGGSTASKEGGFAMLFRMSLRISNARSIADRPYWHIDLNAGCGWNDKVDCPGSPLVFLEQASRVGRPVHAVFCDNDSEATAKLGERLRGTQRPEDSTVQVMTCDNAECLRRVAEQIRQQEGSPRLALGTVLCDPNAWKVGFPIDELSEFTASFDRIDAILNLNVSVLQMSLRAKECDQPFAKGFQGDFWQPLAECIPRFHKRFWYIRNPSRGGNGYRFIILRGSNHQTKGKAFADFFPLDSMQGKLIVDTLKAMPPEQPLLPFSD